MHYMTCACPKVIISFVKKLTVEYNPLAWFTMTWDDLFERCLDICTYKMIYKPKAIFSGLVPRPSVCGKQFYPKCCQYILSGHLWKFFVILGSFPMTVLLSNCITLKILFCINNSLVLTSKNEDGPLALSS